MILKRIPYPYTPFAGEDKKKMGSLQPEEFKRMNEMLGMLEKRSPIAENTVIYPRYYGVKRGDEKFDR